MFGDDAHSSVMFEWTFACLHHSTCKDNKAWRRSLSIKTWHTHECTVAQRNSINYVYNVVTIQAFTLTAIFLSN